MTRAAMLPTLTGPTSSFPEEKALHHWFEDQVGRNPQAIAIVGESDVTYEQLDQRANELARRLMANGAAPDRLVAIYLPRSVNCLVAILGVLKSGAAYLPIDVQIPKVRAEGLLQDANSCAIITETALASNLPPSSIPILLLDDHSENSSPAPDQPLPKISGSHLAYVIPTSGTTGRPKLIGVEHRQTANLLTYATQSLLKAEDVRWVPFIDSPSFDSSISQIFTTLALGGTLVLVPDITTVKISPYYEKFTCLGSTPSLLATILKEKGLPPAVQLIGLGAEAIPPDLLEKLDALPQIRKVINYYGPSEATVYCTVAIALDHSNPDSKVDLRDQGRIIGCPIANTRIYLVDEFGQLASPGALGEIYIAGAAVARGYLNLAGKAAENFLPDSFSAKPGERMYRSGDIACLRADGQLEFHGRQDHQLKLNGVRIEAGEIENALLNVSGVRQALVDVRPNTEGKKRLVAYLATTPNNFSKEKLRKNLRLLLPDSMVPHHFVVLAEMPLTSNGKVDRVALSQCEIEVEATADADTVVTPAEKQMQELWEQNLNRSAVGIDQDYFEMGGDSLSAVNLMLAIEQKFGARLPTQLLLECSTVAELTRQVASGPGASKTPKPVSPASFVFLQQSGNGVPLVILPGGAGTTFLNYKNFAMKFAPDHPVYALQSIYALMLEKPADPLVFIADYIADQIITVIKDRPFVLFGHCIGGLLAWHVAGMLKKKNAPPFELVVYDAPAAQKGINMTTSLTEAANHSRLQKTIRAYRPAWEEWVMENGNGLSSKGGFAFSVLRNFLMRRGFIRTDDGRVRFAKLSYYRLLQESPLPAYPDDALLIYHHSQTEIVASSLWQSLCAGEIEYQFIPGDHSDWQNAILRIIPMIEKKLENVAAAQIGAQSLKPSLSISAS